MQHQVILHVWIRTYGPFLKLFKIDRLVLRHKLLPDNFLCISMLLIFNFTLFAFLDLGEVEVCSGVWFLGLTQKPKSHYQHWRFPEKEGHIQSIPKNKGTFLFWCLFGLAKGFWNRFRANFSHLQLIGQNLMNGGVRLSHRFLKLRVFQYVPIFNRLPSFWKCLKPLQKSVPLTKHCLCVQVRRKTF